MMSSDMLEGDWLDTNGLKCGNVERWKGVGNFWNKYLFLHFICKLLECSCVVGEVFVIIRMVKLHICDDGIVEI